MVMSRWTRILEIEMKEFEIQHNETIKVKIGDRNFYITGYSFEDISRNCLEIQALGRGALGMKIKPIREGTIMVEA